MRTMPGKGKDVARPALIVTRPEAQGRRFLAQVKAAGAAEHLAIASPVLEIEPLPAVLPEGPFEAVVVTSAHGAGSLARLGVPRDVTIWCVGDRTAEIARAEGYRAISADGDAEALVRLIPARGPRGPLIHLRGMQTRGAVAERLREQGLDCRELVVYRQIARPLSAEAIGCLQGRSGVVLPVFSPQSGTILAQQGPFVAPLHLVAISSAAAEAAAGLHPARITIASEPDGEAMVEATVAAIRDAAALERGGLGD